MCAIKTRGLYTFYSIFEGQKCSLMSFFYKILTLCTVDIQEWFQINSALWWHTCGNLTQSLLLEIHYGKIRSPLLSMQVTTQLSITALCCD